MKMMEKMKKGWVVGANDDFCTRVEYHYHSIPLLHYSYVWLVRLLVEAEEENIIIQACQWDGMRIPVVAVVVHP
jgi:hypothetical protein